MALCSRCHQELNEDLPYCIYCGAIKKGEVALESGPKKFNLFFSLISRKRSRTYFEIGWRIFKQEKWKFIGYAALADFLSWIGWSLFNGTDRLEVFFLKWIFSTPEQQFIHGFPSVFSSLAGILLFLVFCFSFALSFLLGIPAAAFKIIRNQHVESQDFWNGFHFFIPLGLVTMAHFLILFFPAFALGAIFWILRLLEIPGLFSALFVILLIVVLLFYFGYIDYFYYFSGVSAFAPLFVLDKNPGAFNALKMSYGFVKKNWGALSDIFFIPVYLSIMISILAILFTAVGLFILAIGFVFGFLVIISPYMLCCLTAAYGDLNGLTPEVKPCF